ncbi:Uncharacterised protein [Vibrio cholerae]|nr:Uncharacterised protein [Vibrio cholerae]CSI86550.1 Uncharacterised protein [Vibrio cholerae]
MLRHYVVNQCPLSIYDLPSVFLLAVFKIRNKT